jgi:Ca2+/Na+ antiporter
MSSNGKMVLFFIGATLFNILLMVVFIGIFIAIITLSLGSNASPTLFQILVFVAFVASIVLTFLVYGKVMKWVTVKWQLEKNIPQLFKGKKK